MDALRRLTRIHGIDVRDVRFLPFIVSADWKYPPRMTDGSERRENSPMPGSVHTILAMTMVATGATAQVRLPAIPLPALPLQTLPHLAISRLIRANPRVVDADPNGEPVVRNEILGLAPTEAALDHARALGFMVDREQAIGGMNIRVVVLRTPQGMTTKKALRTLREADPGGSYDYNH